MSSACFNTRGVAEGYVVSLSGRIGGPEAEGLESELDRLVELGPKVMVLDLAKATMLSSAALSAMVRTSKRMNGTGSRLCLAAVPEPTMKLLHSVRLDDLVPMFPSVEHALK